MTSWKTLLAVDSVCNLVICYDQQFGCIFFRLRLFHINYFISLLFSVRQAVALAALALCTGFVPFLHIHHSVTNLL